jgi:hypothetical protein
MLFEWLGDCGGLISALFRLASLIVSPIAAHWLSEKLVTSMVQFRESDSDRESHDLPFSNLKLSDPSFD